MKLEKKGFILATSFGGALAVAGATIAGCLQGFDPANDLDIPRSPDASSGGSSAGFVPVEAGAVVADPKGTCPTGQVCGDPGATQCTLDSPQCFFQCGSPLCALGPDPGGAVMGTPLPEASADPPIFLSTDLLWIDGGGATTTDPCVQVEAAAVAMRQQSCAPCHTVPAGAAKPLCNCPLTDIMSDQTLTTSTSPDFMTDGGQPAPYVSPGDPGGSLVYQRIVAGLNNGTTGMPPQQASLHLYLPPEAGAAIVFPTSEDLSVLYQWIAVCLPDAGAGFGEAPSEAYGGGLGGSMCFGPSCDGGTGAAGTGSDQ